MCEFRPLIFFFFSSLTLTRVHSHTPCHISPQVPRVLSLFVVIAWVRQLAQQGKKAQGTLWDQEKDELSIRILLEEGKLNLCLRVLQNFKETERGASFNAELDVCTRTRAHAHAHAHTYTTYTHSMGIALKSALFF